MPRIRMKDRIEQLSFTQNLYIQENQKLHRELVQAHDKIKTLQYDKDWLKQLVQEMSSTMNNGSKEGIFPRR